ncbi:MAG: RNA polymerase II-associated protein [Candidatus Electrothrix sp. AR5]|nr:RNA polymerase II-associated protein [Candidatus Electrothrix sp. AR5]
MELECAKYGEKMDAEQAACRHPGDYCQYRTSCMIQFIEREKRGERKSTTEEDKRNS